MEDFKRNMEEQVAAAARAFQRQVTGHTPQSVTAVLGGDTVVITLHGALSPAEKTLARTAAGAAHVQEFHRRLFSSAAGPLREQIQRITGVSVLEAVAEVEPDTGTVVHAFTTGNTVQVFQMARVFTDEAIGDFLSIADINHNRGKTAAPDTPVRKGIP